MKEKADAIKDWFEMIEASWTWEKLSHVERSKFYEVVGNFGIAGRIKGTYRQRWDVLHMIYDAYISGLGYNGPKWRD